MNPKSEAVGFALARPYPSYPERNLCPSTVITKQNELTSSCSKGPVHSEGGERHRPQGELGVRVSAGGGRQDPGVLGAFQGGHRDGTDHS